MAGARQIPQGIDSFDEIITQVNIMFNRVGHYEPTYIAPDKVDVGDVYYFATAIIDTGIDSEGLWQYRLNNNWIKIG